MLGEDLQGLERKSLERMEMFVDAVRWIRGPRGNPLVALSRPRSKILWSRSILAGTLGLRRSPRLARSSAQGSRPRRICPGTQ